MTMNETPFEYKSHLGGYLSEDLTMVMSRNYNKPYKPNGILFEEQYAYIVNDKKLLIDVNDGPKPSINGYITKGFAWDSQIIGTIWIWAQMKGGLEEYGSLYLVHAESGFVIKKRPIVMCVNPNPRRRMSQAFIKAVMHHARNRFEDLSIHETTNKEHILLLSPWKPLSIEYNFTNQ